MSKSVVRAPCIPRPIENQQDGTDGAPKVPEQVMSKTYIISNHVAWGASSYVTKRRIHQGAGAHMQGTNHMHT